MKKDGKKMDEMVSDWMNESWPIEATIDRIIRLASTSRLERDDWEYVVHSYETRFIQFEGKYIYQNIVYHCNG